MRRVPIVTYNSPDVAQCPGTPFLGLSELFDVTNDAEGRLSIWVDLVNGILQLSLVGFNASSEAKYLGGLHDFNSVVSVIDADDLKPIVVGCRDGVEKSVKPVDVGGYSTLPGVP